MMIKLEDFFKLLPETQEMCIFYDGLSVRGTEDALGCMLGEDIFQTIVTDVEAKGDTLAVWVKEDNNA